MTQSEMRESGMAYRIRLIGIVSGSIGPRELEIPPRQIYSKTSNRTSLNKPLHLTRSPIYSKTIVMLTYRSSLFP